jgi:hypothetical protein
MAILAECPSCHKKQKVGTALRIIKEEKLYKETLGFKNFEEYCKERWGFSKTHANRFIASARVTENLTPIGVKPTSESQTRPLVPLEPDQQKEVRQRISSANAARNWAKPRSQNPIDYCLPVL